MVSRFNVLAALLGLSVAVAVLLYPPSKAPPSGGLTLGEATVLNGARLSERSAAFAEIAKYYIQAQDWRKFDSSLARIVSVNERDFVRNDALSLFIDIIRVQTNDADTLALIDRARIMSREFNDPKLESLTLVKIAELRQDLKTQEVPTVSTLLGEATAVASRIEGEPNSFGQSWRLVFGLACTFVAFAASKVAEAWLSELGKHYAEHVLGRSEKDAVLPQQDA